MLLTFEFNDVIVVNVMMAIYVKVINIVPVHVPVLNLNGTYRFGTLPYRFVNIKILFYFTFFLKQLV